MTEEKQLRLSWSRIRAHSECPAKGQLIAEHHKSPAADIRGYFHGTVVDVAERRWLEIAEPPLGWMRENIDSIFTEMEKSAPETGDGVVRWKHADDRMTTLEFCRSAVERLEKILQKICLPYDYDPAVRFNVPLKIPYLDGSLREIRLVGEIDLIVLAKDRSWSKVWDLKATRDDNYWRKVTGQLLFYDIAMWGMTKQWPETCGLIQPMCKQVVLPFQFSKEDRVQMFQRICSTATDIWRGAVLPKVDNAGCSICPVRHACPKFPVKRGRIELPRGLEWTT